jgi:hypothetical protein
VIVASFGTVVFGIAIVVGLVVLGAAKLIALGNMECHHCGAEAAGPAWRFPICSMGGRDRRVLNSRRAARR